VGGDPLSRIDPLGLWSFNIAFYEGVGGGFTIGRDNVTGQWFYGGRLGLGIGGGWNVDPNGSRPGESQTSSCHGTTVGGFVEAGGTVGPWSYNPVEGEGGWDLATGDTYTQGPVNENPYASMGPASFDIGISVGIEVFGH
jgi:hypothetical protein